LRRKRRDREKSNKGKTERRKAEEEGTAKGR
jgi:hypothetical protein